MPFAKRCSVTADGELDVHDARLYFGDCVYLIKIDLNFL